MSTVVSLAAGRRRPALDRVAYELARLRVAALNEPPPALSHLARPHD